MVEDEKSLRRQSEENPISLLFLGNATQGNPDFDYFHSVSKTRKNIHFLHSSEMALFSLFSLSEAQNHIVMLFKDTFS